MENNSERLHYAIALGLGVVGLLIILIFVSIRSQADLSSESSVTISNSTPTITIVNFENTPAGMLMPGTFTLGQEANVLANYSSTTLYITANVTDADGCQGVADNGWKAWYMGREGQTCTGFTAAPSTDACYNGNSSALISQGYNNCTAGVGNADTAATYDVVLKLPYNTASGTWTLNMQVNDGTATSTAATANLAIGETNALTLKDGAGAAVTNLDYGTVGIGSQASLKTVKLYNAGNKNDASLYFYGSRLNCSAGSQGYIPTTSVKYGAVDGTVYSAGTALTFGGTPALFASSPKTSAFTTSAWLNSQVSANNSSYWGLDLTTVSGVGGTCTGTINMSQY